MMKKCMIAAWMFAACLFTSTFATAQTQDSLLVAIETIDDNEYIGTIVEQTDEVITLQTINLGRLSLQKSAIKNIKAVKKGSIVNGQYWFDNPHPTRYFWGPSGYGLKRGEGYYQNIWVTFNQVSYGFTDNFSLGVGTFPVFLFGVNFIPFWITPKISIPIKEDKLNASAGALYFNAVGTDAGDLDGGVGLLYGTFTIGPKDKNLTLGLGYGYDGSGLAKSPAISISGMTRVGRKAYLMSENYILPIEGEVVGILSVGGRHVGRRLAIDYGLFAPISSDGIPGAFPWLGIVVPFGKTQMH